MNRADWGSVKEHCPRGDIRGAVGGGKVLPLALVPVPSMWTDVGML